MPLIGEGTLPDIGAGGVLLLVVVVIAVVVPLLSVVCSFFL